LGLLPKDWQQVEKMLRDNGAAASIPAVSELYASEKGMKKLTTLAGDRAFVVDMVKSADAQSAFNSTYVYRFDYAPLLPELFLLGAAHSTEISTALATNDHPFWLLTPASRREELTQSMHGAWLNFVKTGNPNGPGVAPLWPQYEAGRRLTYIFDQTNTVESNPHGAVYEVWKDIQLYQ
ncbi:carboxylesterase family protein, partial [Desulfovibrio sp.]|uniref:carboxylesterase family protein n=1 Tax=Desulfovibrio sp. TaxID=885 RepID=UPI0026162689